MTKKQTNVAITTVAIFVATFMTAVEGTIVSTAMPTIIGNLHGVELMNWVFSIYLLTNAMVTPVYGKLADAIGRKPVLLVGLVIFIGGSCLAGLAQNMIQLIAFRALQGIGAGAIQPVTFTIIADIYPIEKRAKVLGFNGSAWGIASVVAPLLGGFIVEKLSWHWIFFINLPIGLITIALVQFFFFEERRSQRVHIDYPGVFSLLTTLFALMIGLQMLTDPNQRLVAMIALVIFVVGFVIFLRVEQKASDPVIDLKLFRNRSFVIQNSVAALVSGFLIGFESYMPMWMQGILGMPASMGGFAVTPSSVMWIIGSFLAGHMLVRWSPKRLLTIALIWLLLGGIALATVPVTTPFVVFLVIAGWLGIAFGTIITITTVTVQNAVTQSEVGVATSFNTLSRTLGQTLMVSIFGIVLNTHFAQGVQAHGNITTDMLNKLIDPQTAKGLPAHLLPALHNILYSGLHGVYLVGIGVIVIALICNLFDVPEKLRMHAHKEVKAASAAPEQQNS
ncbi:MDR family MFS transporter [Schleiferilactobacillus perolens]|uniref:MDR family MFS transporter n=2 Tax=Schleiferilactobacillus perolens TaxID=100468 RepID=UPI0039EC759C